MTADHSHNEPVSRVQPDGFHHSMTDNTTNPNPEPAPAPGLSDEALVARRRRIVGLLHDTGLLQIVGRDWVRTVPGGLEFGPLDGRAAEEWLRFVDALAERAPAPRRWTPGAGQLGIPFPTTVPHGVRHHLAVSR